jgi:hypothetical protein
MKVSKQNCSCKKSCCITSSFGRCSTARIAIALKKLVNTKIPTTRVASSRGLVVKAEDSWPRGPVFKPPLWRPFFRHHSFGSKLGKKIVENSNLALFCNPANGRVDFEEWSAYKIQLHSIEWIVSLSADWDQSPEKKNSNYSPHVEQL